MYRMCLISYRTKVLGSSLSFKFGNLHIVINQLPDNGSTYVIMGVAYSRDSIAFKPSYPAHQRCHFLTFCPHPGTCGGHIVGDICDTIFNIDFSAIMVIAKLVMLYNILFKFLFLILYEYE